MIAGNYLKSLLAFCLLALVFGWGLLSHAVAETKSTAEKTDPGVLVKRAPTPEEEEKAAWIKRWCRRAKKDPKCKFYTEKELGKAMREVDRAAHDLGDDEFCNANSDDPMCRARRRRQDDAEKQRKLKELLAYCRENPDALRCEEAFGDEPAASDSTVQKKSTR